MIIASPKVLFFLCLFLGVSLEVIGDILFKKWSSGLGYSLLILGLITYALGTVFWAVSLKYELLSKAISVFTILNLIAVILVGVIFFKEDLSFMNKVGIVLGVISVVLLEY